VVALPNTRLKLTAPVPTGCLRYDWRGNREANRLVVERVLKITGGNVKKAAQLLGVSRNTVRGARGNR
jgi:transcriptional regulator of acetoin/glycerol metabolism